MAVVVPDTTLGRDARQQAETIIRQAAQMKTLALSIKNAVGTMKVFDIYDLGARCRQFKTKIDDIMSGGNLVGILEALVEATRTLTDIVKTTADVNADYKALYAAANTLSDWQIANLPGAGQMVPNASVRIENIDTFPYHTALAPVAPAVVNQVTLFLTAYA